MCYAIHDYHGFALWKIHHDQLKRTCISGQCGFWVVLWLLFFYSWCVSEHSFIHIYIYLFFLKEMLEICSQVTQHKHFLTGGFWYLKLAFVFTCGILWKCDLILLWMYLFSGVFWGVECVYLFFLHRGAQLDNFFSPYRSVEHFYNVFFNKMGCGLIKPAS